MAQAQLLDELLERVKGWSPAELDKNVRLAEEIVGKHKWVPLPGPQTQAYLSLADIILYGGEPGGGKSQLILGLAFNCHENALIMRRQYTDLDALIDGAIKIHGGRQGFNGSPPPCLTHGSGAIDFGAAARIGDEQHWMGRPHDFLGIDEATQFTKNQIRFLRGWLRSTKPGQRTRTILATNPPLTAEGEWVFEMFAAWLDPRHPNPAKPGELRWFVTGENDKDHEVNGPGDHEVDGKKRCAESRTYIPAQLTDNPYLSSTDYQKRLDALPAEIREIMLGGFTRSFKDADFQVIPTQWVREAQARWTPKPPNGIPMCAIGVDPAGGGKDESVFAIRHDGWFAELVSMEGQLNKYGQGVSGKVVEIRRDNADVVIDMGGGYGSRPYAELSDNQIRVTAYDGSKSSARRTIDGKLGFVNKRGSTYWEFREALDPTQPGGSPIMLPDSPKLMADLTAPTFEVTPRGIKIESKESIRERLGRSTDSGDAVVMAWSSGAKMASDGTTWLENRGRSGHTPRVILGHQERKKRR